MHSPIVFSRMPSLVESAEMLITLSIKTLATISVGEVENSMSEYTLPPPVVTLTS